MGGTSYFTFRKVRVCECMLAPLEELVRLTGSAFKVSPIPGFGSYQNGSTASGSTATGGGHIDIYLTGYSSKTKKQVETYARMVGFYADIREKRWWSDWYGRWISQTWAPHLHMLLKDCPHLSQGAKNQLAEWYAGENGLVGHDLDDGDRHYVGQTWDEYVAKRDGTAGPLPVLERFLVRKGDTLGKIAAALGVSLAALLAVNPQIKDPNVIQPGQSVTVPKGGNVPAAPAPAPAKPAPAKPAPAPKPAPKPSTAAPTSTSGLYQGARSSKVRAYEQSLAAFIGSAKARSVGLTGSIVTDGYYGTATSAATRLAYRQLGVTPNATTPGPYLLQVLSSKVKATSNPAPSVSQAARLASTSGLVPGASSSKVRTYEGALRAFVGASTANRYGLTAARVDGYYGTATSAVTQAAYRKLGVTPNATRPGPYLLGVLNGPSSAAAAATSSVDASKLHKGVSSRHVTAYQRALRAYVGTSVANRYNPAGATGYYGTQTQELTKAAYRKMGATPWATEPGPGLLRALGLR